jgi:hypothetical protein
MKSPNGKLSSTAKQQIQNMRRFRAHPATHEHAIAGLVALIRQGDITQLDDARSFCADEEWTEAEIASLARTIDDVGFTLKTTGIIQTW